MTASLPCRERLRSCSYSLGQSAESVVISLRIKKPAAKHPFKPLVLRLRLKYAGKPVAAKIKASTKKAIPFSQKFDEAIISEANTQRKYCFLTRMDFFSGFLRRQNSCRNSFEIRQLLREVGYWVVRSFPLANIPSVRVSEKLFFMALSDLLLLISRNMANNNKRLCRPSFTESQQSLFRSQYRIGCDSKPANHSLAIIRTNKMALVSAIILLSNGK